MATRTILCVLVLAVASFAAPIEEAVQIPEKTQISTQLNVQPALSVPPAQVNIHEKQEEQEIERQEQAQEPVITPAIAEIQGGELSPDLLAGAESLNGEKSDLDTANSYWGGWGFRRRGWGWGGGWGGYYRPYWGGYRGGWRHGWGRGYGGWGGYW